MQVDFDTDIHKLIAKVDKFRSRPKLLLPPVFADLESSRGGDLLGILYRVANQIASNCLGKGEFLHNR